MRREQNTDTKNVGVESAAQMIRVGDENSGSVAAVSRVPRDQSEKACGLQESLQPVARGRDILS